MCFMKRRIFKMILCLSVLSIFGVIYSCALPVYTYESSDRGMAEIEVPWKGRSLDIVEKQFEDYRTWKQNPDLKLYRTCNRIWYAPNLWLDNLTNRRWSIPYMEPSPEPKIDYYEQMRKGRRET